MDSLLRAATPALELAGLLLDPDRAPPKTTPIQVREAAEAALSRFALLSKVPSGEAPSSAPAQDALLALAALLDELALREEGALADHWRGGALLQQRFLHPDLTTAGDRFFERLEELLVEPRATSTLSILRIYAICLEAGFKGRFAAHDDALALAEVRTRLRLRLGILVRTPPPPPIASPPPPRRELFRGPRRRLLPKLVGLSITTIALALAIGHRRLEESIDDTRGHIDAHRRELLEVMR